MRLLLLSLSALALALAARAIHESEVGIVDWHTKLVGVPLDASPPVFHDDVLLTATTSNVLAALNATDGTIVWRSIHDAQDAIVGFKVHDDSVYALSGPSGSTLRVYDVSTGHLVHEKRLHGPAEGKVHDPPTLGIAMTLVRAQSGDQAIVLTNGDTVHCVQSSTGDTIWHWRSDDQGSLVMYTHIYPDTRTSTLYVAGFAKSVASYTLHVTTLDLATGHVVASVNIPANMANALTDYLLLGPGRAESPSTADTLGPSLVWLSPSSNAPSAPSSLFSAPLSPSLKGKVSTLPGASYKRIQDVDLSSDGLFMAFRDDGTAEVLAYESSGSPMRVVWDFGDVTPSASSSDLYFVGAPNEDGKPCIGKVAWSSVHNQAVHQTFEARLQEGTGQTTGFAFPFERNEHGTITHVAFSPSAANEDPHKLLLVTSTGSLQLWDRGVLQWVREESLATVQTVTIIELPPTREEISVRVGDKGESFWSKIARQVGDAKNFPHYVIHFVTRFATGSYASPSSPVALASSGPSATSLPHFVPNRSPASPQTLVRDPFSFRQLLIVSTSHGKLFALDTSTGAIVWSRILGLGWARKVGGRITPVKAFVVRRTPAGAEDGVSESQEGIALVTQRVADNSLVDTVVFHFDPLTGDDIETVTSRGDESESSHVDAKGADGRWISPLEGVDAIAGPLIDVFLMPDGKDTICMLDEFLQVQLYPDTPSTRASLTSLAPQLYLAFRAGTQVLGHQFSLNDELSSFHVAFPTWGISFGEDEEVVAIITNAHKGREVASIGKVKGDRSTLYKYLNPHLNVVISAPRASLRASGHCGLYVVDTVKGTVLYHVSLPTVDGQCDIQVVLDENWLVYSYYDDSAEVGRAKGYRVVSVEMYEGRGPDEKISSSDITSYSNKTTTFSVYEQAFAVPHGVTAIATTTTKFGVSTKDIIISSRKNAIHTIPRRLLNPRRPKRKPTNEEVEEMLVQYEPVLPDDGRLVLSHHYEVADVRQIVTAPSLLESTSLVLAVGTDLFLTRVATSGTFDVLSEDFNKMQLVLTVIGLAVAIAVTKPMVQRKQLRERWYR